MNTGISAIVRQVCGLATAASLVAAGPPAKAADEGTSERASTLEEVVVTAQKREETLQSVPISISVMSGAQLDKSTSQTMYDVLSRVPGVAITGSSAFGGAAQVTLRGVAPTMPLFGGASTSGYYLDGVPTGFVRHAIAPDPSAFDFQRIEVLRGPQGTLYGANALNGVVRVLTADPDSAEFDFKARALTSSTEDGGQDYRGDMAVNVPIVADKFAARATVGYQDMSGWVDKPNKKDANDAELLNARLKLKAQPTENLSIGLMAWLSRTDYGAPNNANDTGVNPSPQDESIESDFDAYALQIDYQFPSFSVSSTTSYLKYSNKSGIDLAPGVLIGGVPLVIYTHLMPEKFSQELLFNSTSQGDWRWSVGGMYSDVDDRYQQTLAIIFQAPEDVTYSSTSSAIFGEVTRLFLGKRLELTAGLRYFQDTLRLTEHSRVDATPPDQLVKGEETDVDATTPRLAVTWHASEQLTLYVTYSEGFRSGQFQSPSVILNAPEIPPAEPDRLHNYEVGTKGRFLNGRLAFDFATYYVDWQDVQQRLTIPANGTNYAAFVNGTSASGTGVDVGLIIQPVDRLEFGISGNWNDLTLDSDLHSAGLLLASSGDRLVFSPEYTITASADYTFPVGRNGYEMRLSASATKTAPQLDRALTNNNTEVDVLEGDTMLISRASVSLQAPSNWSAMLFADNLGNEDGVAVPANNPNWQGRARPRVIGLQFDYNWR